MLKTGAKAFVIYNKKLLLILRDNKPDIPSPNKWGLPGGAVEKNETILEAIERELQEEINIIPKNIIYLGKQICEDGSKVFRYFTKITKREFQNIKLGDEGQKLEFFSLDEIKQLDLAGYFIEYFFNYMNQIKEIVENNIIPEKKLLGLV
jgi:8-oxo-dGTP diphosphatase